MYQHWTMPVVQNDSIIDASGNKIEQQSSNVGDLDRCVQERLSTTPLDLSGSYSVSNISSRDVESPLDLSLKTRKRHADSTEPRDMYLHQHPVYSMNKRHCTNVISSPIPVQQRHLPQVHQQPQHPATQQPPHPSTQQLQRGFVSLENRQSVDQRQIMQGYRENYKKQIMCNLSAEEAYRSSSQNEQSVMDQTMCMTWPDQAVIHNRTQNSDTSRRPSQLRYQQTLKSSSSSDEQYYAMLQTIQKQNAAKKLEKDRECTIRIQDPYVSAQTKILPKNVIPTQNVYQERPHSQYPYLQKSQTNSDTKYNQASQLWRTGIMERPSHCRSDNSISNAYGMMKHRTILPNTGNHGNNQRIAKTSVLPASNMYMNRKFFGAETHSSPTDQRQPYLNRPSKMQQSPSDGQQEGISMASHTIQAHGARGYCPIPMVSSRLPSPVRNKNERSIVKGTSGVHTHNQFPDRFQLLDSGKSQQTSIPMQTRVNEHSKDCQNSCDGHEVSSRSSQLKPPSILDHYSRQAQLRIEERKRKEELERRKKAKDCVNDNRLVTQLFRGIQNLRKEDTTVKDTQNSTKTYENPLIKKETNNTEKTDNFSSPLCISIPASKSSEINQETKPKAFSKKHIIMNAVNKDEDLMKIVNNQEKPKTVIFSGTDIKRSQTSSPVCPESPKMPTLSPQQRPQPPYASQQIGDPPTLDIDGSQKQDSFLGGSSQKTYFQDKRPRLLSSLPRKPQPVVDEEEDEDTNEKTEVSIHDNSVFAKRPFLHYKKIPIANVAPMVHENCSENTSENDQSENGSVGRKRKIEETLENLFDKHITSSIKSILSEGSGQKEETQVFSVQSKDSLPDHGIVDSCPINVKYQRRLSDSQCVLKTTSDHDSNYKPLKIEKRHRSLIHETTTLLDEPSFNNKRQISDLDLHSDRAFITLMKRRTSTSKAQKKADDLCRRARERQKQRHRNKKIQENQSLYIKCRRHSKDAGKGFIDFKPEVLVNRTRTQAASKAGSASDIEKYEDIDDIQQRIVRRKKKTTPRKKQQQELVKVSDSHSCTAISNSPAIISLKKASVALTDCTNVAKTETKSVENKELLDDGTWIVKGSTSSAHESVPEGDNAGITMKLLYKPKPKRRFRRRSSTKRIGKCRRRKTKFRKKPYVPKGHGILPYNNEADDEVFANDDELSSITKPDSESRLGLSNHSQEIKKLVVCKDTGETMLHRAARLGHLDVVIYCLQSGDVDVNTKDNAGYSPLHECCVSGNLEIARLLLSRGASVNCASQDGIRPIHDAVENDHVELVRLLIVYGADPTLATYGGICPEKIARGDSMKSLIHGCLGDINGFEENDERARVWEFDLYGSDCLPETEVLNDVPEDPDLELESNYIQESSSPCFTEIKTYNEITEQMDSFVLLRDVCEFYKVRPSEIQRNLGTITSIDIYKEEIEGNSQHSLLFQKLSLISATHFPAVEVNSLTQLSNVCKDLAKSDLMQQESSQNKNEVKKNSPCKYKSSPLIPSKISSKECPKHSQLDIRNKLQNKPHKDTSLQTWKKKLFPEEVNQPSGSGYIGENRKLILEKKNSKSSAPGSPDRTSCSGLPSTSSRLEKSSASGVSVKSSALDVFDMPSEDSSDEDNKQWQRKTDLKIAKQRQADLKSVKYKRANAEMVSKTSVLKYKSKH